MAVSGIGVAVKTGHALPDMSTPSAFRQALLNAKSVGCSEGASGTYFIKVVVPKLGLTEALASKGHVVLGRRFVGEELTDGVVELGFTQISELLAVQGIERLSPLGTDVQRLTVFRSLLSA